MEVNEEAHNSATGGHFGAARTEALVASRFFWKGLRPMVRRYVQGCEACQRAKPSNHKPYGLLQPLDIPEERWRRINVDFTYYEVANDNKRQRHHHLYRWLNQAGALGGDDGKDAYS
jgi:hypothetical protein